MNTPAGKECPHYYEDFNRGRTIQECRLAQANPDSMRWRPKDCERCAVPEIVQANASPHMKLTLTIRPALLGFVRQKRVEAWCIRHDVPIENPYVGCPLDAEENPALKLFRDALDE
ncbi:MAG: hypothetical protein JXQ72_08865 [Anaerolineae bacterium]|nr:hypothetical protein [Anaerolineae bacterium]